MKLCKAENRSRRSRGQVTVLLALGMSALMGFAAMGVDAGYLLYQKRRLQGAADAAAIAGALEVVQGTGNMLTAAAHDAALNGFTSGVDGVSLTVNNPPSSGPYSSQPQAVEAILNLAQPTFFLRLLHIDTVNLTARSVAGARSGPNCIYVLDPHASAAFGTVDLTGSASLTANCGMVVDSDSSSAISLSGEATLSASAIGIVGGYSAPRGAITPTPVTGISVAADPLASIAAPAVGTTCAQTNYALSGGTVTLNPGTYCGGIRLSGGATATLNPGTYILDGGGLTLSGGSSISGTGVTFYNTAGSPGNGFEPISLAGGSNISLSAPTSGPLAGILFFEDRSITSTETNDFTGSSSMTLNGALYFPTGALKYSGGNASTAYTIVVADTIDMSGASSATVNADYSSLADGSPIKSVALME